MTITDKITELLCDKLKSYAVSRSKEGVSNVLTLGKPGKLGQIQVKIYSEYLISVYIGQLTLTIGINNAQALLAYLEHGDNQ